MSKNVAMIGWYLENTLPGHHKFYTVLISDTGVVTTSWGKIGTQGQSKVQKLTTFDEARDIGLRQLYAKKSKGYVAVAEDVKFVVPEKNLLDAMSQSNAVALDSAFHYTRLQESAFAGDKGAVFQHYDSFAERAQKLLDKASKNEVGFDDLFVQYEALKAAWAELDDKHAQVATTVTLLDGAITKALLGGAVK